jgi:predicted ATPase
VTLATEHGFAQWAAYGMILRGRAVSQQGNHEEGVAQIRQGLAVVRTMGAELVQSWFQLMLAEAYGKMGKYDEGLAILGEALAGAQRRGELAFVAELYRLRGELTLQKCGVWSAECGVQGSQKEQEVGGRGPGAGSSPQAPSLKPLVPNGMVQEAEGYFFRALDLARQQRAKSWELRAAMSLFRLRQRQDTQYAIRNARHATRSRITEAHTLLSEVYNWFTEGFDTPDLQEAKALLEELSH